MKKSEYTIHTSQQVGSVANLPESPGAIRLPSNDIVLVLSEGNAISLEGTAREDYAGCSEADNIIEALNTVGIGECEFCVEFEVNVSYIAHASVTVEATSEDEADEKACAEFNDNPESYIEDAPEHSAYDIQDTLSIEEMD